MEKKKLASKSHLELLIPDKKKKKQELQSAFTEEEVLRSETWHGKKDVVVESSEAKTADRPKRGGTLHSLEEARARKAKKQKEEAIAVPAGEAAAQEAILDLEDVVEEEKPMSAAELREAREREEGEIGAIAQEIFDKRMQGVDAEGIDAMLVEKGIKPWTPEAEAFMRTWDWEQAEKKFKELAQEREAAVLAANEAMLEKSVALRAEQMERVSEKFGAFNIDLETLPKELKEEFETLTYGQRLLLAENLQQLTLGRVQEEAKERYQKVLPDATLLKSKWLGRIWQSASKKYQIAGHAQATALDIKKGGLAYHGELLQQLVEGAKRTGLDAIEGKDGMLELQYVQEHPLMTERQKEQSKEFNRVATLYSKIPYEWSLATATTDQKKEYERMHAQFEHAKEQILKVEQGIIGDKDSLLFVADIENKIRLNQFVNTHPDAEKQLQSIESDNVLKKVAGDIVTERGIYFGAGLATRTFATGLLGAIGFPLAAVGMGGWMARKRAAETLRERDIAARQGKKDTSNEARNVATAHVLFEKLEGLVARINSEPDEKKRQQHLAALQVRLEYTKNKLDAGLVDFGSVDRRIVNQYGLMDALTQGDSTLLAHDADRLPIDDEKNVYRGLRFWRREEKVAKAQKDYLRKQMIYGAGLGIGFFAAGYYAKDVVRALWDAVGPAEAHAATGPDSIMRDYASKRPMRSQMMPAHKSVAFSPPRHTGEAPLPGASDTVGSDAHRSGPLEKHPIPPRPDAHVTPAQETIPSAGVAKGATTVAREAAPSSETLHTTLDIGKRGPEGAFIDELKKHPEVAQRLGIKDIGKEAHAAWMEFAKQALKDPQTIKSLQDHGFAPNAKGYEEMMRRIASGKIILEEQNGKLHMRIDDTTEYLKARAPKHGISGSVLKDNDIPTGPQFLGRESGPLAAAPAQPTLEDIPTGPQILGGVPDVRPNAPLAPGVEHIADQAIASDADDIPKGPQILGGEAKSSLEAPEPFAVNVNEAVRMQPHEGIVAESVREHVSSAETFVTHQFGMSGKEYAAIKQIKVSELLRQIPSRDEAWSIWRGDVQGKAITLPHDGSYGAVEFKKHVDLAEHIRAMQPDAAAMQTDVDTFIKHEVKSIVRPVAEAPIAPEPRVSPIIETKPLAPDSFTVEDIPAETQSHNVPPSSEVQPHTAAPSTESVQPISAEAPIDGGGVPASSHVEHAPSATSLTPEKLALLEDDIYRSKMPIQKIIMQYKVGNITPEDFARYYLWKVAKAEPSPEVLENIKATFAEAAGEINPQKRVPSQRALYSMVLRMQKGE